MWVTHRFFILFLWCWLSVTCARIVDHFTHIQLLWSTQVFNYGHVKKFIKHLTIRDKGIFCFDIFLVLFGCSNCARIWLDILMDNRKHDNSFELFNRRHSTRDSPASSSNHNANTPKRYSLQTGSDAIHASRCNNDAIPPYQSTISIISGNRSTSSQTTGTQTTAIQIPSVKVKLKRKKSTTSDATDQSDSSNKPNQKKGRNALTSSFLRRKRIEYAGIHITYSLF